MKWRELQDEMSRWSADQLESDIWVANEEEQEAGVEAMRDVLWTAQCVEAKPARTFLLATRCGPTDKEFRVVSISSVVNDFGLNKHIFIARDGTAWQALAYRGPGGKACKKGDVITVPYEDGKPAFFRLGWEMAEPILTGTAPVGAVREIWGEESQI